VATTYELIQKVEEDFRKKNEELYSSFDKELFDFLANGKYEYIYLVEERPNNKYYKQMMQMFSDGKKPSDFFMHIEKKMKGYISEKYLPCFYYAIDHVNEWQISDSMYRKSYRSADYRLYPKKILSIAHKFRYLTLYEYDIYSILTGNTSEELAAFMKSKMNFVNEVIIAATLDMGDEKLEGIIEDIIMGDGGELSIDIIRGIVMSHNTKMYELLGKLLLAARLQEGLRQSVCEAMDRGTKEGFLYLFNIIQDNNLIRFSSVRRALAVCTGLLSLEEKNVERISDKQITLIGEYLLDSEKREQAFHGEDSMEIYLALWSYGFEDIEVAFDRALKLIREGTHHQRLVAAYFIRCADIPFSVNKATISVFKEFNTELDTVAVIMGVFMEGVSEKIIDALYPNDRRYGINKEPLKRVFTDYRTYFESEAETREVYGLLKKLLTNIPKKSLDFKGLAFPWNDVSLTSTDVVRRMAFCASALHDDELIIEVAENLGRIVETYSGRGYVAELLLAEPERPELLRILTNCISDGESMTRESAIKLMRGEVERDTRKLESEMAAPKGRLPKMCYDLLGDMLRYKKSDVRANVLELLSTMPEEEKTEMIDRLLLDKSEEKRTAALDMVLQMKKNNSEYLSKVMPLVEGLSNPTTKELILINEIVGSKADAPSKNEGYGIFYVNATYEPVLETEYLEECKQLFAETFPNSRIIDNKKQKSANSSIGSVLTKLLSPEKGDSDISPEEQILKKLDDLIEEHKHLEYTSRSETELLGNEINRIFKDGKWVMPFKEIWDEFFEEHIKTNEELVRLRLYLINTSRSENSIRGYYEHFVPIMKDFFGPDLSNRNLDGIRRWQHIYAIVSYYLDERVPNRMLGQYASYLLYYMATSGKSFDYVYSVNDIKSVWMRNAFDQKKKLTYYIVGYESVNFFMKYIKYNRESFEVLYAFAGKYDFFKGESSNYYYSGLRGETITPRPVDYISACDRGIISRDVMFKSIMDDDMLSETLEELSNVVIYIRETAKATVTKKPTAIWKIRGQKETVERLIGKRLSDNHSENSSGKTSKITSENVFDIEENKAVVLALECFEKISSLVLGVELVRGDTETEFSQNIFSLKRLYGVTYLVKILSALGKETLDRSRYYYSSYSGNAKVSKKESLSHLLKNCMPDYRDGELNEQVEKLAKLLKGTDIKESRLIEAALFSPEWLEIIGQYLGWEGFVSGCYYFMAHMNERFDDNKKAVIAKYTPLTPEELNAGAFDKNWFDEVYEKLGKKHFDMIYTAAKYISDGAKHSRARKYADASSGKFEADKIKTEIEAKRNKDLLMAYGLIPAKKTEYSERYIFLQKFLKESKKFGAQRRASEKLAYEMAVKNMATAAGYSDETRFILRMESNIASELKGYFEPREVGEVSVWLEVDEEGKIEVRVKKGEKMQKSIPAKIKKDEYIVALQDTKKELTEQYRRTRLMMEEAMESETEFFMDEIVDMESNPVSSKIVDKLIFKSGDKFGFAHELKDAGVSGKDKVIVAHPVHMYKAGVWRQIQKQIFDNKIKQPFKQVFRELYVKTDEEKEVNRSMRYAGNQIQPKKTMAMLGGRRWVTDVESGLQKIYYKENIIAGIFALADWFAPSDIEEPTLEWVVFTDRKNFNEMKISDVPDVIFSEVMRDVDLAVSVAHAGGVDPEMSHSTVEMRKAIAEFTVESFKLGNVNFTKTHAIIEGKKGTYTIHLGSGVIHQEGGPMINVLPVHSQSRGRIFLPFVDDDPKTAEIMSKILMFAEDNKIKDPFILEQIV
jgi:hypothetical protein